MVVVGALAGGASGPQLRRMLCVAVLALVSSVGQAKDTSPAPSGKVMKDIAYKTMLFDLYTKDYLSALIKFEVAASRDELAMAPRDKDQFRGGLMLSYGIHNDARQLLRPPAGVTTPPAIKNLGWYYTAKTAYRDRDLESAWSAANEVRDGLPADLAAEVAYWKVEYLIAMGRYDEAARQFSKMLKGSDWYAYAMFNLGVAQLRAGQAKEGLANLVAVGRLGVDTPEMLALADKANLTVGYFYLRERKSAPAVDALTRVRLVGPFSNKALLGLGWAHSFERRYAQALVPWMELRQRTSTDVTVQESMLATPFAYAQVAAPAQAVRYYEDALERYIALQTLIENSMEESEKGSFFAPLFEAPPFDDVTLSRRMRELGPESRAALVSELFGNEEFQSLFRAYRDVLRLKSNLDAWVNRIDLLQGRARAEQPAKRDRAAYLAQVRQLREKYNRAVSSRDYLAFAEANELARYERIAGLQHRLDSLAGDPSSELFAQRLRVQKGLLQWDLNASFDARARKTGSQLGELLARTQPQTTKNEGVPAQSVAGPLEGDAVERLSVGRGRAQALSDRCGVLLRAYQKLIQEETLAELERKRRLTSAYLAQARYGVAQIYDEANSKLAPKK